MVVIREHLIRYTFALQDIYNKDVLDVACGTGYGMYLMSFWAKTITGYDYDENAVKGIKRDYQMKCPAYIEVMDFEKERNFRTPLIEKFDVITSFETIEHLANPIQMLESIRNHLKPGGVFLFSTPNRPDLKDGSQFHKSAFNFDTWRAMIKDQFPKAEKVQLWGQDQYGLTNDEGKPYLVGRIKT